MYIIGYGKVDCLFWSVSPLVSGDGQSVEKVGINPRRAYLVNSRMHICFSRIISALIFLIRVEEIR